MKKRRLLAGILAGAMLATSISFTAYADEAEADAAVEVTDEAASDSAVEVADEAVETEEAAVETEASESADLLTNANTFQSGEQFVTAGDWQAATFGNSCDDANIVTTDSDGNTAYKNWVNALSESTVTMHAEKGKIGDGSNGSNSEGIVLYYQPVSLDEDFTISATATVNDYTANSQVAFGLEMRDQVFDNLTNPSQYLGASVAVGGFRLGSGTLDAMGFYYNDDGAYVSANKSASYPTDAALFTGSGNALSIGDSYDLKLEYNSTLGMVTLTFAGTTSSFYISELETTLTFEDEIYVGSFVAREADVTFTNLKLTTGQVSYEAGSWVAGQSYQSSNPYTVTADDYDNPTTVSFSGGAGTGTGKLSDNDEEYAYFVSELEEDANFTLSATATVDSYIATSSSANQIAFGIVFRSTTSTSDNSYTDSETSSNRHSPSLMLHFVSASKTSSAGDDYTGVNIRYLDKNASSASYINLYNTAAGYISTGQTYDISVAKSGTAYLFTVTDNQTGETYSGSLSDPDVFSGKIYPGFFAARSVDVTYSNISLYVDNRTVTDVKVTKAPTQTEYYVGENFNSDGMEVTATYDDGSSEVITDYIATYDTSAVGDTVVTIVKGSCTTTTPITVRKKNVTSIDLSVEPLLNRYYEYQLFSYDGITGTITYEDGTTEDISDENVEYSVDGSVIDTTKYWTKSETGSKTVYVSFIDTDTLSGNGVTTSYGITILPYSITGLSVYIRPNKVSYAVGEELDTTGLIVQGIYTDGSNYYYDYLSSDAYTLSGFDSSTVGTKDVTVTLNANKSYTTTFAVSISLLTVYKTEITHYPRTSYVKGTSTAEIEDTFLNDAEITVTYSDDSTYVLTSSEFTVDASEVDSSTNGTYDVYVTPTDTTLTDFTVEITIWNDKDFYWKSARFGASSSGSGVTLTNADEYGLADSAYIYSINGTGKITNSYHDGIGYYYTRVNPDNNFTLSGDVEVESYLNGGTNSGRQGQEAFGLMARDVIPLTPADDYSSDSATFEGLGTTIVVKTENAKKDENGEPVPLNTGTDFYGNIVLAGGYTYESYPTVENPPSARQIERANSNRIRMFIRYGVAAWDGSNVSSAGADIYTLYDGSEFGDYITTYDQLVTNGGECFYPKPGDVYHIELSRINGGYYVSTTILAVGDANAQYEDTVVGLSFSYAYTYTTDEDPMVEQNDDTIYVGFFAARYASIYVSNIELYESSTETDYNKASGSDDIETPGVTVSSSLYTSNTNYSLKVKTSNATGGTAIIKLDDEVIANHIYLNGKNTTFDLNLEENTVYDLTIYFEPNPGANLTSYDSITYSYKLYCLSNVDIENDTIYVAPVEGEGTPEGGVYGSFTGAGTKESPLDIDAALAVVDYGQTIILLNGTYLRDEVVNISEANFGFATDYKTMKAETDGKVIIDMQRNDEGLNIAGDYWWVKGIKFLNSGVNSQGGGLSGSHCIVENCTFAESGTTGFQISGSSSDPFKEWPSYNLIVYCEAYNSAAGSTGTADGFGCKLTVGNGNMFKNCVSHNNEDDGWDLYTKTASGPIGAVLFEGCISYDDSYYLVTEDNIGGGMLSSAQESIIYGSAGVNKSAVSVGDRFLYQSSSASGNGFKLGGESVYVQHYIKDSFAFGNKAKGFDSNSNPAMKVRNCVSYNNGTWKKAVNDWGYTWSITSKTPGTGSNFGLYSSVTDKVYNYNLDGAISVAASQYDQIASYSYEVGEATNQADSAETLTTLYNTAEATDELKTYVLTLNKNLTATPVSSESNYLVGATANSTSSTWGYTRDGHAITGYAGYNSNGDLVTADWFVSLNESDAVGDDGFIINHNADGSWDLGNFLKLTSAHTYTYAAADVPDYSDTYELFFNGSSSSSGQTEATTEITTEAPVQTDEETETTTKRTTLSSGSGGGSVYSAGKVASTAADDTSADTDTDDSSSTDTSDTAADTDTSSSSGTIAAGGVINPPTVATATAEFTDLSNRAWAVDAINKLASYGIITGVTDTSFCPDNNMTRGDFCVLISRLLGLDTSSLMASYSDVDSSSYYSTAIAAAAKAGIASGYSDTVFAPAKYITREEMFVLIAKTYEYLGADITADESVLDQFSDAGEISSWAVPYAAYLVQEGIVNGTDGKINPSVAITRAETAVILSTVYDDAVEVYETLLDLEAAQEALEAESIEDAEESEEEEAVEEEVSEEESEETEEAEEVEEVEEAAEEDAETAEEVSETAEA